MCACIERLGADSPAALLACDTFLSREVCKLAAAPPVAHEVWAWGCEWEQSYRRITPARTSGTGVYEITAFRGHTVRTVLWGESERHAVVDDRLYQVRMSSHRSHRVREDRAAHVRLRPVKNVHAGVVDISPMHHGVAIYGAHGRRGFILHS